MTSITFEVATLADAIRRAAKVAPTVRGAAWDKANGIVLRIYPGTDHPLTVNATNLELFHTEWVSALDIEGGPAEWRLPSIPLSGVLNGLPIGGGRQITFTELPGDKIELTSGKMKCTLRSQTVSSFPFWEIFDPDDLSPAPGLANAIKSVEWAAATGSVEVYSGIHISGEFVMATDRWRAAIIPCEIPHLLDPVTIPVGTLTTALKETSTPKMGSGTNDNLLYVMPDDWTQLRVAVLGHDYPSGMAKRLQRDFDEELNLDKEELIALVNQAVALDPTSRTQTISLFFGRGEIAALNTSEDYGIFRNIITCNDNEGQHKRVEYKFNPKYLIEAVASCKSKSITFRYGAPGLSQFIYLTDKTTGYETWVGRITSPNKGA